MCTDEQRWKKTCIYTKTHTDIHEPAYAYESKILHKKTWRQKRKNPAMWHHEWTWEKTTIFVSWPRFYLTLYDALATPFKKKQQRKTILALDISGQVDIPCKSHSIIYLCAFATKSLSVLRCAFILACACVYEFAFFLVNIISSVGTLWSVELQSKMSKRQKSKRPSAEKAIKKMEDWKRIKSRFYCAFNLGVQCKRRSSRLLLANRWKTQQTHS